jgi:hypothetical protein
MNVMSSGLEMLFDVLQHSRNLLGLGQLFLGAFEKL